MKLGIALGGGGMKGMAHIGALRIFQAAQIEFDIIVGTSAGAMAGALYAAGKTADDLEHAVRTTPLRRWFGRDRSGMDLFSTDGIRQVLESQVGKDVRIEHLPRRFAAVAVDLDTQREVVFDSGPLVDAVCASAAYPGLFAPVSINNRLFVDGGVLNPVPFDAARRLGAEYVVAIDLWSPEPFDAQPPPRKSLLWQLFYSFPDSKVFRVVDRSIGIMMLGMRDHKLEHDCPDVLMMPKLQNVGIIDFERIDAAMAAGEASALEAVPKIKQDLSQPRWWYRAQKWFAQRRRV